MAWWEREYQQESSYARGGGAGWNFQWPPMGARVLFSLHVVAFIVLLVSRADAEGAILPWVRLDAPPNAWPAILFHPLGVRGFSIVFVGYVIWSLGGLIEGRLGRRQLLRLYIFGNLLAGAAYFAIAPLVSRGELYALDMPLGALAAWALLGWRQFHGDSVLVFNRMTTRSNLIAIGAAIVVGMAILGHGSTTTAWLLSGLAGCAAVPLAERLPVIRFGRGRRSTSRPSARRPAEPDIDDVLAKISRQGLDALTDAERARLEAARQAKLDATRGR